MKVCYTQTIQQQTFIKSELLLLVIVYYQSTKCFIIEIHLDYNVDKKWLVLQRDGLKK